MSTTFKMSFDTADQAVTCTLTSLASSATAGRESTVVDNSTNLYLDVNLFVKAKTASGSLANDKAVYYYFYGTTGGTTYPAALTGSDAAATPDNLANLANPLILNIDTAAASRTRFFSSVVNLGLVGLYLPKKWGVFVRNYTGLALSSTGSDMAINYEGLWTQGV